MTQTPDEAETSTPQPDPLGFELKVVKTKPKRKYRKGSKYDPVIDKFMEGTDDLVAVEIPGKDGNYLRTQLKKRIDAKKLGKKIEVSVVNNICHLEKVKK